MIDPKNYTFGLPVQASTYADKVDNALNLLHVGMALIFVLWLIFFVYCLVRFRKRSGHAAEHAPFKSVWTSFIPDAFVLGFELWLVFMYGLPIWSHIKEKFPADAESVVVQMTAEQFSWGFQYAGPDGKFGRRDPKFMSIGNPLGIDHDDPASADDIVTRNEMHVPLGKPTVLYMTSKDVIHSFFVPEFRTKQDVVPGLQTKLWFTPNKVGRYEIACAQLCGTAHYAMRGEVVVVTPEEFEAWLQQMAATKAAAAPPPVMEAW